MNLKEAFRYMNFLENLMYEGFTFLDTEEFVTRTKEIHLRSKTNPDIEDEVIEDANPSEVDFNANTVIYLEEEILKERESLSKAISKAKQKSKIDIDLAIASNKKRQAFIGMLRELGKTKSSERIVKESGYKFNSEGNQVSYVYDVKKITTIDFDRNKVKKLIKTLSEQCDKVSCDIDRNMLNTEVEFEPKWALTDTIEDICEELENHN